MAAAIVRYREKKGSFKDSEDLKKCQGPMSSESRQ
jgi:DNA uptake protein ComE-like DNA-binding protein